MKLGLTLEVKSNNEPFVVIIKGPLGAVEMFKKIPEVPVREISNTMEISKMEEALSFDFQVSASHLASVSNPVK